MSNRDGAREHVEDDMIRPLGERLIELGIMDGDTRTWVIEWEEYHE